tara:strand:- start:4109 stop:4963 length:855 start_codon:yes stop_codon:yes gene_type:complete
MNNIKYFIQFIFILVLFLIYKILGLKYSSLLSGKIFTIIGPLFRSKKISHSNLAIAFPKFNEAQRNHILNKMWFNYGRIFAEYLFIKELKKSENIIVENQEVLDVIKMNSEPVIFISGHFNNFELMAMHIERTGIDLAAIYRPLNNKFLNPIMEYIRKKYICKKQIKKGIAGTKELLQNFKNGTSIALMIDQRVSQGIKSNFFNKEALTTTIPAQFVKKFKTKIVPIYIERENEKKKFRLKVYKPLVFKNEDSIDTITYRLNKTLEEMIIKNPDQWIWTHNRWK